jgi:hypothetical protein
MKDFAKGAERVFPYVAQSSEEDGKLDDILVNRGMYDRLVETSDMQSREIEALTQQLQAAQDEIEALTQKVDDASGYEDGFANSVRSVLTEMTIMQISETYNKHFFEPIPQSIRVNVCNVLITYFDENGEEPNSLWYSIVAKGGVL